MGVTRVARHSGHVIAPSLTWRRRYSSRQSGTAGFARDATRDAAASPHRETYWRRHTEGARAASRVEEETRASRHASTAGTRAKISSHTRGGSRGTSASRHVVVVVVDDETPLAGSTAGRSLASGRGSKSHLARGSASRTAWRKYPFMDQCSLPRAARRCARSVASLAKGPDFFRSSLIKPVSSERGVVASRVCARASAAGPQSSAPSSRRPHVASGMRAHSPGVPDPRMASPCAPGGVARRAG